MKDIKTLLLDSEDRLSLSMGGHIQEEENESTRLVQKIVLLLKQSAGSNLYHPEGFSLKSLLSEKIGNDTDMKVKISLLIKQLEQKIIEDQEQNYVGGNPEGLLEKITISDISAFNDRWKVGLLVYDKAGGKIFVGVNS